MTTTEAREFATEISGILLGDESRAFTIAHPVQLTVARYLTLDRVEPADFTPLAVVRVRSSATAGTTSAWTPTAG